MVLGVVQCKLFSSGDGPSWTLPIWIFPASASFQMTFPADKFHPVLLHTRIGQALGIQDGDELQFEIEGLRFKAQVSLSNKTACDISIEIRPPIGFVKGFVKSYSIEARSGAIVFDDGQHGQREVALQDQELWAGLKISELKGGAILQFDGASRTNPGLAGTGFTLYSSVDCENPVISKLLVKGYRFLGDNVTSNVAEYEALLEGLTWACRFGVKKLWIRGDSELVINQISGAYVVRDERLMTYHSQITELLNKARAAGKGVEISHVSRSLNSESDSLANQAIDSKENVTLCDWDNINEFCKLDDFEFM